MSCRLYTVTSLSVAVTLAALVYARWSDDGHTVHHGKVCHNGIADLIGGTPLMKINSLSDATGCEIYGKLEMQNPGGSAKDRVALAVIERAEKQGLIRPHCNDKVFEGTSGSTGISIAMLCRAKGYEAHIVLPDDTSQEKVDLLTMLGAVIHKVRPAGIADQNHYVNYARKAAEAVNSDSSNDCRAIFADQFENEANWTAHYHNTGPEIYHQTKGKLDAFVTGAGTGGTIAGVARYLKEKAGLGDVKIVLADPVGSGLYNRIKYGVMFDIKEKEGTRRRHQVDTLVEGIGVNRITQNLEAGREYIDDAIRVTDEEALKMARLLVDNDGLFVGSSSAVHCTAVYKYALQMGPGHTLVTVICDSGARHMSKFWKAAKNIAGEIDLGQIA